MTMPVRPFPTVWSQVIGILALQSGRSWHYPYGFAPVRGFSVRAVTIARSLPPHNGRSTFGALYRSNQLSGLGFVPSRYLIIRKFHHLSAPTQTPVPTLTANLSSEEHKSARPTVRVRHWTTLLAVASVTKCPSHHCQTPQLTSCVFSTRKPP